MTLRDVIQGIPTLQTRTAPLLTESQLAAQALRLKNRHGFVISDAPSTTDITLVYHKLYQFVQTRSSRFNFSKKEWKMVPWAFIQSVNGNPPLFENNDYIHVLFSQISAKAKFDTLSPLIQVFLQEYPLKSSQFEQLRVAIHDLVVNIDHVKANTIKQWVQKTSILSKDSHMKCSDNIVNAGFQPALSMYKLTRGLEYGGFAIATISHFLSHLESKLATFNKAQQNQKVSDCIRFFLNEDNSLKYPSLRVNIADGLLSSYVGNPVIPQIKKLLTDFFVHQYNDPRTTDSMWIGVKPAAVTVIKGWLVENTMHDFFNLLSHIAKTDSMADDHWRARKRFWNAYLRNGHIQEAWVALGNRAYSEAHHFLKGGHNTYARLSGGQAKHSALIMVIDGVLVTEWSHSGSYRLWDSSQRRPKLYSSSYHRDSLVSFADYTGPHTGSENGKWQQKLSYLIQNLTGVSVSYREYMND